VETPGRSCDDEAGIPVSLPGPGYIANLVTEATGCGGVRSPWRVEVRRGQTIRLSLLDFSLARPVTARTARVCVWPVPRVDRRDWVAGARVSPPSDRS